MMYANEPTIFMRWASDNGAHRTADGLGMLVEQAAAAFTIWHHVTPNTEKVLAGLRVQP